VAPPIILRDGFSEGRSLCESHVLPDHRPKYLLPELSAEFLDCLLGVARSLVDAARQNPGYLEFRIQSFPDRLHCGPQLGETTYGRDVSFHGNQNLPRSSQVHGHEDLSAPAFQESVIVASQNFWHYLCQESDIRESYYGRVGSTVDVITESVPGVAWGGQIAAHFIGVLQQP
jgi:hypothetical protein